jgi:glycogen debranching enzyme
VDRGGWPRRAALARGGRAGERGEHAIDRNAQHLWDFSLSHLRQLRQPYGFAASEPETGIYHALFGRDSLWTLLFLLEAQRLVALPRFDRWLESVARDIVTALASHQGQDLNDAIEEQPGKIIHEYRETIDQRLEHMCLVFDGGRSYAGFDQTFLFVIAVGVLARNSPFEAVAAEAWPALVRALDWMDSYADPDGDGLFEYERKDERNLLHQSWRDSFDSVTVAGADVPIPPIAWLSVQAYAYMALGEAAALYARRGDQDKARRLRARATALQRKVNATFWIDREDCYAIGLDGAKRTIPMVSSDAGHALWAGIPDPAHESALVRRLLRPDMTTAYGLRTLSSSSSAFCPFAYHRGNTWPFDNGVFVMGLLRLDHRAEARRIIEGVADALFKIGAPIELYVVLDRPLFVKPEVEVEHVLLMRRENQENRIQSWTAAALAYMAAALARLRDIRLEFKDGQS